jgi:hypothetical protein
VRIFSQGKVTREILPQVYDSYSEDKIFIKPLFKAKFLMSRVPLFSRRNGHIKPI